MRSGQWASSAACIVTIAACGGRVVGTAENNGNVGCRERSMCSQSDAGSNPPASGGAPTGIGTVGTTGVGGAIVSGNGGVPGAASLDGGRATGVGGSLSYGAGGAPFIGTGGSLSYGAGGAPFIGAGGAPSSGAGGAESTGAGGAASGGMTGDSGSSRWDSIHRT